MCHVSCVNRRTYCHDAACTNPPPRQFTFRAYDPEVYPERYSKSHVMRAHTYLDLLRATRPAPQSQLDVRTTVDAYGHTVPVTYTPAELEVELEKIENLTISDLCVLPEDAAACLEFSVTAEAMGAKEIGDFLVRPGAVQYVDELPWEEAVAGCIILDCMCRHPATAASTFSPSAVYYLGRSLFILRWMFAGGSMVPRQLQLVLCGVQAAAQALTRIATGIYKDLFRESQMLAALPVSAPEGVRVFARGVNRRAVLPSASCQPDRVQI